MPHRMGTIGGRLLLLVAVTGSVTAALVSFFVLSGTYSRDRRNVIEAVTSDARVLAIQCEAPLLFHDPEAAQETLEALAPNEHLAAAVLFDRNRREIARFDRGGAAGLPELSPRGAGHEMRGSWLIIRQPVRHRDQVLGVITLAHDVSWITRDFVRNLLWTILASLVAVGVGVLVALPLQRSIALPVQELIDTARRVARTERPATTRARKFADDELGSLTTVFNRMLDRIEHHERRLTDVAHRLRTFMNTIPAFVWVADASGVVEEMNERWHDYTGLSQEDARSGRWKTVVHPDDVRGLVRRWTTAVETGSPYANEVRLRGQDGRYRWFATRALPARDESGRVERWYGTTVDIEDRRRIEDERVALLAREREAREEAEQANRLKDEFLATLSHEIRTPMSAILGWVQVLNASEADLVDENVRHGLEVIERNARAQAQIIEDLLDMSRIVSGKLELDPERVDLAEVVRAAQGTVHPAAVAKEIRIVSDLAEGCVVRGDMHRLQQVVWNLLANAAKFTPAGGRIDVVLEKDAARALVQVRDTGKGIDPQFLPRLFERFRQADSSTTRQYRGLGLGLAIVKQLTELHGGSVAAWSEGQDKGATFTVELPLAAAQRHERPAARPAEETVRGEAREVLHILLVEDEDDTREVLARMLARHGFRVRTADSATTAMELLRESVPDLLISDIGMPNMDGYELIRRIRQAIRARGADPIPAIALTAFARIEDRDRALSAGFSAHLAKPVEEARLLECIRQLGEASPNGT